MNGNAARGGEEGFICSHWWWRRVLLTGVALALPLIPAQVAWSGTTYTYDALGRVISARQDDGRQTVYVYDAAGNRIQSVVSGTTINRAPVAVPDTLTLFENQASASLDPTLNDTDPDGSGIAVFSVSNGSFGQASNNANLITYGSSWHRNGQDTITYTVTDVQGLSSSGRITVTLANLPPVAVADSIQSPMNMGRTFDPTSNDSDPGGDPLKISAVTAPAHGTATITPSGTSVMYLPTSGFTGADTFSYVASDGDGGTSTATVNVDVVSTLPPPPVAVADQVILQGSSTDGSVQVVTFDPRQNDLDPLGKWIRIVAVSQPSGGVVSIVDGGRAIRIERIGGGHVESIGSFDYVVEDGIGRQAAATISSSIAWN